MLIQQVKRQKKYAGQKECFCGLMNKLKIHVNSREFM